MESYMVVIPYNGDETSLLPYEGPARKIRMSRHPSQGTSRTSALIGHDQHLQEVWKENYTKCPVFFRRHLLGPCFWAFRGRFQPGKWTMIAQELAGEPAKRWSIQSKLKGPVWLLLRARLLIAQPHMVHAWVKKKRRKAPACFKFKLSSRWLLIGCWCS